MSFDNSPFTDDELIARRPVWEMLSWLFLDTTLDKADHMQIADTLRNSPYGMAELEKILYNEVYPVCIGNTSVPAGAWSGFDSTWLEHKIIRRLGKPSFWPKKLRFRKAIIAKDWQAVKSYLMTTD